MENLLENLNEEQLKAVTHKSGPLLIVAGAGTGKTTAIAQRVAYLIERNLAAPHEILALTFTEKAAGEMEERVERLLPIGYLDLWISTFHAFGERLVRDHGLSIGLPAGAKVLNEFQQWALVKKNLAEFKLDYYRPLGNPTKFIHALVKHFARLKDEDISPADYLEYAIELKQNLDGMLSSAKKKRGEKTENRKQKTDLDVDIAEQEVLRINEVANAYHVYQQLLLDSDAMDFGDLINYSLKILRERPAILDQYRRQFKYVLVDEFQDTNWAQYELVKLLAAPQDNLAVVGDDDQCLPGYALVEMPAGRQRIDRIREGDLVMTAVGRGYASQSPVTKVMKKMKKARFLTFSTRSGRTVTVTDNHKLFCYVPAKQKDRGSYFFVYLMEKQGTGWRIGITNDLAVRLRLERSADRIVAISSFATEAEARYHETLWSLKYGIPSVCFQERDGIMDKRIWSGRLYRELPVESGARRLAVDLGIDLGAHQLSLNGVRRGGKTRIKISLEMNARRWHSKEAKNGRLQNPQILHQLTVDSSDQPTQRRLETLGFKLTRSKKGKRVRVAGVDIDDLCRQAQRIARATGGIIDVFMKAGRENIRHQKALVVPAGNVFPGMHLPVATEKGIIYDQIISRLEKVRMATVYDLEISRTHNFIANGVVVHNSIYKFRGASVSNILQFKRDYPEAEEILLARNYRSRQNILDLAYDFIQLNNPNRLEVRLNGNQESLRPDSGQAGIRDQGNREKTLSKKLVARDGEPGTIEVIEGSDQADELRRVAERIAELKIADKAAAWSDFAILARSNDGAREAAACLEAAGLPFQYLASRGLYGKPAVMDLVAYLKLMDDYHESPALFRVLSGPDFGFTTDELMMINNWARRRTMSLFEVLRNARHFSVGAELAGKIGRVLSLVDRHSALARSKGASEVALAFLHDSGIVKRISRGDEAKAREEFACLNQFIKRIQRFEAASDDKSVKAFLAELELELESGEEGALAQDEEAGPETVKVMTVHAAKGLEFKYVFLVSLVDKRFPTIERKEQIPVPDALVKETLPEGDIHLEEERRLFYVALTRAKQGLFLCWSPDYGGQRKKKPSRFLAEAGLVTENRKEKTENRIKETFFASSDSPERGIRRSGGITAESPAGDSAGAEDSPLEGGAGGDRPKYPLPDYYSYTQLTAFKNCPYQYRFAHILKVPKRDKFNLTFGRTMHDTLQKVFQLVMERRGLGQGSLFSSPLPPSKGESQPLPPSKGESVVNIEWKEIKKIYEECWEDSWYESPEQKNEYRELGLRSLKDFFAKHRDNWPRVLSLEQGINFRLDKYRIYGKIDRVDDLGERGLQIVDYKTGNPKEAAKLSLEDKEQLLIYQMAAAKALPRPVANLKFYYLNDNSEIDFLGTPEETENMAQEIVARIREIEAAAQSGEFLPKPGVLCRFCDYYGICEYRQNGR